MRFEGNQSAGLGSVIVGAAGNAAKRVATGLDSAFAAIVSLISSVINAVWAVTKPLPGRAFRAATQPRLRPFWIVLAALTALAGPRTAARFPAAIGDVVVNAGKEWAGLLLTGDASTYASSPSFSGSSSCSEGSRCGTVAPPVSSFPAGSPVHAAAEDVMRQLRSAVDESSRILTQLKANAAASAAAATTATSSNNAGASGDSSSAATDVSVLLSAQRQELEALISSSLDGKLRDSDAELKKQLEALSATTKEQVNSLLAPVSQSIATVKEQSRHLFDSALLTSVASAVAGGGMIRGDLSLWEKIAASYARARGGVAANAANAPGLSDQERSELLASVSSVVKSLADQVALLSITHPSSFSPAATTAVPALFSFSSGVHGGHHHQPVVRVVSPNGHNGHTEAVDGFFPSLLGAASSSSASSSLVAAAAGSEAGDATLAGNGGSHGGASLATLHQVAAMINSALAAFSADTIASPDYALASSGACVVKDEGHVLTSKTWMPVGASSSTVDPKIALTVSLPPPFSSFPPSRCSSPPLSLSLSRLSFLCLSSFFALIPHEQPSLQPGHCWPMAGHSGNLTIKLSRPISISAVAIDHLPSSVALRRLAPVSASSNGEEASVDGNNNEASSLPLNAAAVRSFNVWGFNQANANANASVVDAASPRVLLGRFSFDAAGPQTQVFVLPPPSPSPSHQQHQYSHVQLEVLSNHGQPDFTCLYRFRVSSSAPAAGAPLTV